MRSIARLMGKEDIIEDYIKSEHERVLPKIEELRKKLSGVKGFVATGSSYAHGMISVIRELGIAVDGSIVFHHDPVYDSGKLEQDTLKDLVRYLWQYRSFYRQQNTAISILWTFETG